MDTSLVETDACLKVVDAMLKAARTSLKPKHSQVRMTTPSLRAMSLPLESTAADLLALQHIDVDFLELSPASDTSKSPVLDAMLKAARTNLPLENTVLDAMLKAARINLPLENTGLDFLELSPERDTSKSPVLDAMLKAARPNLPLESTNAEFLELSPERDTSKLPVLDAMLKAARTSLKPNNPQVRMTTPSLRAISLPLESTVADLLAMEPEQATKSPVLEVIKRRRSIGQMSPALPDRTQIEKMLEAATYAPNHHVTEPWHFWVLTGEGRERFGAVLETSLRQRLGDALDEKAQRQLLNERKKPLRAPVIITVALRGISNLAGDPLENIEAAAAAVQNMLLIAEEMGLATIWRTGDPACDPLVKAWFGLSADDPIIGFIYVGYPKIARAMRVPAHFSTKTTWVL